MQGAQGVLVQNWPTASTAAGKGMTLESINPAWTNLDYH